ncbi:hypothetical protein [Salinimicrobium terrae]|uniref:hypothetical protein n=1 Tax=Salinimicrobium terrae TaxID=470866 RepID=UPI00041543C6|nr:hypothetical protein [Salinimicrobium terrae]
MKKFIFLFIILLTSASYSQGTSGMSEPRNVEKENFLLAMVQENFDLGKAALAQPSTGHQVFIEQIGSYNVVEAKVVSEKNNLNINQHGNQNTILMEVMSKSTTGNITQTGHQNYSLDFANDPTQEINLDLTQNGNGHHFERYGSNSIGNNLKFEMTGESQTIIVRNFK